MEMNEASQDEITIKVDSNQQASAPKKEEQEGLLRLHSDIPRCSWAFCWDEFK